MMYRQRFFPYAYLVLIILGLLLFLPIREAVSPAFSLYDGWWCLFALGFTIPVTIAVSLSFKDEDKGHRVLITIGTAIIAFLIFSALFGGAQWIYDHVSLR